MPYSTQCNTVLSNFEAGSNYKKVRDPSILITFPTVDDNDTWFIAWTTTPWTLPSNLALAVNPDMTYIKFEHPTDKKHYIISENRQKDIFKMLKIKEPMILEKYTGKELENTKYVPLFEYDILHKTKSMLESYITSNLGPFRVICEDFVSDSEGTGIGKFAIYLNKTNIFSSLSAWFWWRRLQFMCSKKHNPAR